MNMENEYAKQKKKDGRNVLWTTVFLYILFLTFSGIQIYLMLVPDTQLLPDTEKFRRFFRWGFLLFFLIAAQRTYKIVSKYVEKYGKETKMPKILSNNRTFFIGFSLLILLSIGIGWYLGGRRHTQEMLNAEPIKIYKAVKPLKPKTQPPNTREATTSVHSHEEATSVTPSVSDMENTDMNLNLEQSDLSDNTKRSGDITVSEKQEEAEHEHTQSKEEQEASKKLMAEAEKALESAKQIQKEGLEMMREAMPIVANHLNTLSTEEQIEMLRQLKTTMLSQTSQFPPELQSLIEEHNVVEEGWEMYLDMLAEAGYTPPRDFE